MLIQAPKRRLFGDVAQKYDSISINSTVRVQYIQVRVAGEKEKAMLIQVPKEDN